MLKRLVWRELDIGKLTLLDLDTFGILGPGLLAEVVTESPPEVRLVKLFCGGVTPDVCKVTVVEGNVVGGRGGLETFGMGVVTVGLALEPEGTLDMIVWKENKKYEKFFFVLNKERNIKKIINKIYKNEI